MPKSTKRARGTRSGDAAGDPKAAKPQNKPSALQREWRKISLAVKRGKYTYADLNRKARQNHPIGELAAILRELAGNINLGGKTPYIVRLAERGITLAYLHDPRLDEADYEINGQTHKGRRTLTDATDLRLSHLLQAIQGLCEKIRAGTIPADAKDMLTQLADKLEPRAVEPAQPEGRPQDAQGTTPGPAVETDNADTPCTLSEFMGTYCVSLSRTLLNRRVESLKNAAESKKVKLPAHVMPWKRGQSHKYRPSDLRKVWPRLKAYLPDLPDLKSS